MQKLMKTPSGADLETVEKICLQVYLRSRTKHRLEREDTLQELRLAALKSYSVWSADKEDGVNLGTFLWFRVHGRMQQLIRYYWSTDRGGHDRYQTGLNLPPEFMEHVLVSLTPEGLAALRMSDALSLTGVEKRVVDYIEDYGRPGLNGHTFAQARKRSGIKKDEFVSVLAQMRESTGFREELRERAKRSRLQKRR